MSYGQSPRTGSPEVGKEYKPENNGGCGMGNSGCGEPTKAKVGSARYKWELEHGKLVTVITTERVKIDTGTTAVVHSYRREVCNKDTSGSKKKSCCAIRYKVIR